MNKRFIIFTNKIFSIYANNTIALLKHFEPEIPITLIATEDCVSNFDKKKIDIITISDNLLYDVNRAFLFKTILPEYMNDKDQYLYIDTDIIINKSITKWFDNLKYYEFVAVENCGWCPKEKVHYQKHNVTYLHGGIMIFPEDKTKIRKAFSYANKLMADKYFGDNFGDELYIAYALKEHRVFTGYINEVEWCGADHNGSRKATAVHYTGNGKHTQGYKDHLRDVAEKNDIKWLDIEGIKCIA